MYTPHVAALLSASSQLDENDLSRVEMVENAPLLLPSSLPSHIRTLSEMKRACDIEKRLRVAQADDALADIRKQRRIVQGLWQFKRIQLSGTGNRPNTKILTLYNRINHKIERAAHKYRTARLALLNLDPDGTWKDRLKELRKEDIRGPGKDGEKTSNGRFEPSWIWLVQRTTRSKTQDEDEFNDGVKVEWMKMRARVMRWREEYTIVQEEMRRVLAWFEWRATWWEAQATQRGNGNGDILHGVSAYAFKQAAITLHIAARCAADWLPELAKAGINPVWGVKYSTVASKNTVVVTSVSNNNAAVTVASNNGVAVDVTSDYDADMDCESIDDDEVDIVDIPSDTDHDDSDVDDFFEYDD